MDDEEIDNEHYLLQKPDTNDLSNVNVKIIDSKRIFSEDTLDRQEVIEILAKGPISPKRLINELKTKLKNEKNKLLFKDIIKETAILMIHPETKERFLELNSKYS